MHVVLATSGPIYSTTVPATIRLFRGVPVERKTQMALICRVLLPPWLHHFRITGEEPGAAASH